MSLQDSAFFEIPINGKYVSQIGLYLKRPCSVFVNSLISYGSIEKPLRARTKKNRERVAPEMIRGHENMTKSVWESRFIQILVVPSWLKNWFKVGLSK